MTFLSMLINFCFSRDSSSYIYLPQIRHLHTDQLPAGFIAQLFTQGYPTVCFGEYLFGGPKITGEFRI